MNVSAYGRVPYAESRERFTKGLQLMLKAWIEPHRRVSILGSTPESGEFAARVRPGLSLAFTTLPLAKESARYLVGTEVLPQLRGAA